MPPKTCKLALFTWTCIEKEGCKDVAPTCPAHPGAKVTHFGHGNKVMVTCNLGHGLGAHLVGLCEPDAFEAEREIAKVTLGLQQMPDKPPKAPGRGGRPDP